MNQPEFEKTFVGWRMVARQYLLDGTPPEFINWSNSESPAFSFESSVAQGRLKAKPVVSKEFLDLAECVSYARDEDRWSLLYRLLYRIQHEDENLMKIVVDQDVLRAQHLAKSVRRDIHKLHAFIRFKKTEIDGNEIYVAWHKPEHYALRLGAPFFARRFGDRKWSIFTPYESAHWDLQNLSFGAGMPQHEFQTQDDWDEVWKTYYKSIFNPARIKIKMMKSEMSPKYWSSMPETELIAELVREAPKRLQEMAATQRQVAQFDESLSLQQLKESASSCQACPLYQKATQTVFGEGDPHAKIMIVGEQPGDQEDLQGQPFVGPAAQVLEAALRVAGLKRKDIYITNAVKHFKWTRQGKMRLHQKPSGREMQACKPWLEAEVKRVQPKIILALGTTAATAVLGRLPKISTERGQVLRNTPLAPIVIVSWHPSAILRALNSSDAEEKNKNLQQDLQLAVLNL